MAADKGRNRKHGAGSAPLDDKELKKRGVQVKSGPEAVSPSRLEEAPADAESVDIGFSLDEIESAGPVSRKNAPSEFEEDLSVPDFSFSTDEEAEPALPIGLSEGTPDMDGSMELGKEEEVIGEAEAMEASGLAATDLPEGGSSPSMDEFADLAEVVEEESEPAPRAAAGGPDLSEFADLAEVKASSGDSEELSLDDFGLSFEPEPPKEARKGAKGKAEQTGSTDEVSLDDFLDGESFEPPPEAVAQIDDTPLPIEMDLEFDDGLEAKPLSLEIDEDSQEKAKAKAEPFFEEEEEKPKIIIDTEVVTDFDEFLSSDGLPQAIRPAASGQEKTAASVGSFVSAAAVDDISIEDQTSLVGEVNTVALGMEEGIEHGAPSSTRHGTNLYQEDTEAVLANIEDIGRPFGLTEVERPPQASRPARSGREDGDLDEFASPDTLSGEEPLDAGFDDLGALEDSLTEEEDSDVSPSRGAPDPILQRIADELSSIKQELATLKGELSSLRSGASHAEAPAEEEQPKKGGFFDEEEDETISLTGDELDNILNTADFTEENLSEAEPGESPSDIPDLIPLDGEPPIAEIALGGEEPSGPGPAPSGDDKGLSDLKRIEEEGIRIMTEAPDDTSYLEEPISEELEEMSIPDADLEEPDLSDFAVEELDEGFTLEEAPPVDGLSGIEAADAGEGEYDDITLDIDAPPVLAEAPSAELGDLSIPEDEGPESEISLADETAPAPRSQPVSVHPDDLSMELDSDLFVPPASEPAPAPERAKAAPRQGPAATVERRSEPAQARPVPDASIPDSLKKDIKSVLTYMDRLLESLPEEKIEEFARSEHFSVYKKLFEELGLV